MKLIGIDLAGKESNPTGFAVLSGKSLRTTSLYSDDEIISSCVRERPTLIAIDAPLSMPRKGNLRKSDLTLIERGLRVLPPTLGGMRELTERGMRIAGGLRRRGLRVIEVHPRTSGIMALGTDRRERWVEKLRRKGFRVGEIKSKHEIDAALAAVTAWLHASGRTEMVGNEGEGIIVIPLPRAL